ncbi:MAG TPA: DNA-binding protein [Stellaceae bacterium]|nr:DNA-binding protein [Stellaceae bacterium]
MTFCLPDADADPERFLDALFDAGCDDATVGAGRRGMIALEFTREAPSADEAIRSAITGVERAIPGARLIEAKPDLVNLSDIADLVGMSRQNIRKYAAGEIRTVDAAFPAPSFSGRPAPLWHFYEVAVWLVRFTELRPTPEIIEASLAACKLNLDAEQRRIAMLSEAAATK